METVKYKIFFLGRLAGELSGALIALALPGVLKQKDNDFEIAGAEDFENALLASLNAKRTKLAEGDVLNGGTLLEGEADEIKNDIAELEALHEGFRKALLPKAEDPQPETNTPEDTKPEDTKPEDTKPEDTKLPVYDYLGKVCDHFTQPEVAKREDAKRYEEVFEGDGENAKLVGFRKLPRFVFYVGAAPGQVAIEGCENEAEAFEELKNVKLGTYITRKDVGLITAD